MSLHPIIGLLGGGRRIRYLLRDLFSTDEAAPLATPRTCEPGPGTWAITDTNSLLSISNDRLVWGGVLAGTGIWGNAQARTAGLALLATVNISWFANRVYIGWTPNTNASVSDSVLAYINTASSPGNLIDNAIGQNIGTQTADGADTYVAVILRSTGSFLLFRQGGTGAYTLLWVRNTLNTATIYPGVWGGSGSPRNVGNVRVLNLGNYDARFKADNGLATSVTALPVLNTTGTHTADCLIELSGLVPSADATSLLYRSTSDTAGWRVDVNTDGNVYLQELNAGTTQRGSAAHGVADGAAYRVVVIAEGNVHKVYVNSGLKITYTDATAFNATATAAKVLAVGTGDTLANLIAWPRTITLPAGV